MRSLLTLVVLAGFSSSAFAVEAISYRGCMAQAQDIPSYYVCMDPEYQMVEKALAVEIATGAKTLSAESQARFAVAQKDWETARDGQCAVIASRYVGNAYEGVAIQECTIEMIRARIVEVGQIFSSLKN